MFQNEMFEIRCIDCGKTVMVSFQPEVSKPFYCRTCFAKYMSRETETVGRDSRFGSKQAWARRGENSQGRKREEPASVFQQH